MVFPLPVLRGWHQRRGASDSYFGRESTGPYGPGLASCATAPDRQGIACDLSDAQQSSRDRAVDLLGPLQFSERAAECGSRRVRGKRDPVASRAYGTSRKSELKMATLGLVEYADASPEVREVYDYILTTRKTDYINNF